jgi:hypothetical protein
VLLLNLLGKRAKLENHNKMKLYGNAGNVKILARSNKNVAAVMSISTSILEIMKNYLLKPLRFYFLLKNKKKRLIR